MMNTTNLRIAAKMGAFKDQFSPRALWEGFVPFMIVCMALGMIVSLNAIVGPAKAIVQTASWYEGGGYRTHTASGSVFYPNALTAASWKYHFGQRVLVTNKANGKSVVCVINDRGPAWHLYRKGRVIDLSRGAFKRIADLKTGVINVSIKELK